MNHLTSRHCGPNAPLKRSRTRPFDAARTAKTNCYLLSRSGLVARKPARCSPCCARSTARASCPLLRNSDVDRRAGACVSDRSREPQANGGVDEASAAILAPTGRYLFDPASRGVFFALRRLPTLARPGAIITSAMLGATVLEPASTVAPAVAASAASGLGEPVRQRNARSEAPGDDDRGLRYIRLPDGRGSPPPAI